MKLSKILNIRPGLTSIIGGGGKTSLMYYLAKELSNNSSVIITTTTKIYPPEICPNILFDSSMSIEEYESNVKKALKSNSLIAIGTAPDNMGKLSASPLLMENLIKLSDYVLVEADGAKHLPLKAHNENEPVIPVCSNNIIYVVGISALGKAIANCCHRPEIYIQKIKDIIPDINTETIITPEIIGTQIKAEKLGDIIYINQADDMEYINGEIIANIVKKPCIMGSLHKETFKCLY